MKDEQIRKNISENGGTPFKTDDYTFGNASIIFHDFDHPFSDEKVKILFERVMRGVDERKAPFTYEEAIKWKYDKRINSLLDGNSVRAGKNHEISKRFIRLALEFLKNGRAFDSAMPLFESNVSGTEFVMRRGTRAVILAPIFIPSQERK